MCRTSYEKRKCANEELKQFLVERHRICSHSVVGRLYLYSSCWCQNRSKEFPFSLHRRCIAVVVRYLHLKRVKPEVETCWTVLKRRFSVAKFDELLPIKLQCQMLLREVGSVLALHYHKLIVFFLCLLSACKWRMTSGFFKCDAIINYIQFWTHFTVGWMK